MAHVSLQLVDGAKAEQLLLIDRIPTPIPALGITVTIDNAAAHTLIEPHQQRLRLADGSETQHPCVVDANTEIEVLGRAIKFVLLWPGGVYVNAHAKDPNLDDLQLYVNPTPLKYRRKLYGACFIISALAVANTWYRLQTEPRDLTTLTTPIAAEEQAPLAKQTAFNVPAKSVVAVHPSTKSTQPKPAVRAASPIATSQNGPALTEEWRLFGEYQMEARFDPRQAKQKIAALGRRVPKDSKLGRRIQEVLSQGLFESSP